MTRKESLRELLVKVKAGDRMGFHTALIPFMMGEYCSSLMWYDTPMRAYNGSMDAALSLFEAVLPGWRVTHMWGGCADDWRWNVTKGDGPTADYASGQDDQCSRALLIAILEALVGMEDG